MSSSTAKRSSKQEITIEINNDIDLDDDDGTNHSKPFDRIIKNNFDNLSSSTSDCKFNGQNGQNNENGNDHEIDFNNFNIKCNVPNNDNQTMDLNQDDQNKDEKIDEMCDQEIDDQDESHDGINIYDGGTNYSIDDEQQQKKQKPQSLQLALNVIVTDTDEPISDSDQPKLNKTKKFYESDDPFITKIFSQTITSTTVTPTDDYSYNYDSPIFETEPEQHSSSVQESQTENLDNYNEPQITVLIDDDDDDPHLTGCGIQSDSELSPFEREDVRLITGDLLQENDLCEKSDNLLTNQQRPSIVVDFYNENDAIRTEPYYDEPVTPEDINQNLNGCLYFHQTIDDTDDIDQETLNEHNSDINVHTNDNNYEHLQCMNMNKRSTTINTDKVEIDVELSATTTTTTTTIVTSASTDKTTTSTITNNNCQEMVQQQQTKSEKAIKKKSDSSGKKKSKKSKISDPEKENISVIQISKAKFEKLQQQQQQQECIQQTNQCTNRLSNHSMVNGSNGKGKDNSDILVNKLSPDVQNGNHANHYPLPSFISSNVPLIEDDLSNINVKNLKKIYLMGQLNQLKRSQSNGDHRDSRDSRNKNDADCSTDGDSRLFISKYVSVKHLCRSFGDLSALYDDKTLARKQSNELNRTKSVGDIHQKLEQLSIQTKVSVRALRDSYCTLIGLCQSHMPSAKQTKTKHCRVSFGGIKQFDMKSSFSKFDALQKKNILQIRSSDAGKTQEKFNDLTIEKEKNCKSCGKQVYKMEEIKAERSIWHKQCFKCSECNKQLNVDTYESHESILYCKPHFRALFTPKAVEDSEPVMPRKPELIIRENQPIELPPDVVRSSDKADLGLDELQQLNVRSRYQIFELSGTEQETPVTPERLPGTVKRSPSILSKLAKFQAKGMNVGLSDDCLENVGESSDDEQEPTEDDTDDENGEDIDLIRAKKAQRERPLSFANMNDIKSRFESGHAVTKEERREERKQEIQNIRSRLFLGKQAKIKEMYQQAVLDSEQGVRAVDKKPDMEIGDKARQIKSLFEKGEVFRDPEEDGITNKSNNEDEKAVFEQGIGKKSRTIFMEMDANASKAPSTISTPVTPPAQKIHSPKSAEMKRTILPFDEIVRCDEKIDEIKIETADISNKFKFFETYKPTEMTKKQFRITPPRDGVVKLPDQSNDTVDVYIDPDIIRSTKTQDDPQIAENSHTTTKMLNMFRQMEEQKSEKVDGRKPLKCFTPPPNDERQLKNDQSDNDCTDDDEDDDENDDDDEDEYSESSVDERPPNYVRSSDKDIDEYLMQSQSATKAKQLRAKFERWESKEILREQNNSSVMLYDGSDQSQIETAKEIRAKFESMQNTQNHKEHRDRIKVNRFV